MRGNDCLGVLVFGRNQPREFSPKEITLAESFRDQALIAIENTRLFNETKEALERQTATAAILGVIAQARGDVQPVLDAIVHSARELAGGLTATLWLVEGGRGTLLARTRTRPGADDGLLAQHQLVVAQTYLASPAITLEPLVVPDIEAEPQINDEWRQIARSRRLSLHRRRADAARRCLHRPGQRHPRGAGAVPGPSGHAVADLRRPGGDRDPEREDVPRNQ